ncbi:MAG: hypothetical protein ACE5LH_04290 [Fidelibacterota bacterium]
MVRVTVLVSYMVFSLGSGLVSGSFHDECWPACSNHNENQAVMNPGSCTVPDGTCCPETARLAPLPAKPSTGYPPFHTIQTYASGLRQTGDSNTAGDTFVLTYLQGVQRPPSYLIPLRI